MSAEIQMREKTKTLLEEAIKSWCAEIKELNHTSEWVSDKENQYGKAIIFKKKLIEDAKILIKEII
jgi:hypothetical protein